MEIGKKGNRRFWRRVKLGLFIILSALFYPISFAILIQNRSGNIWKDFIQGWRMNILVLFVVLLAMFFAYLYDMATEEND